VDGGSERSLSTAPHLVIQNIASLLLYELVVLILHDIGRQCPEGGGHLPKDLVIRTSLHTLRANKIEISLGINNLNPLLKKFSWCLVVIQILVQQAMKHDSNCQSSNSAS
jgi:hypothetical protein